MMVVGSKSITAEFTEKELERISVVLSERISELENNGYTSLNSFSYVELNELQAKVKSYKRIIEMKREEN